MLTANEAKAFTLENIFAPTGLADGDAGWFTNLNATGFVWPDVKK
jgi:hypothetical protein